MHALWNGSINFGLVNIPVRLYSGVAPAKSAVHFHYLHAKDKSPVRFAKICKEENQEVPSKELVKGFEYEKGQFVVMTPEEIRRANAHKANAVEIVHFAEEADIPTIYFEHPYFLEPLKKAGRPYALLCKALEESGKVAVCKFVMQNREHLAILKAMEGVLVMNELRFASELKDPAKTVKVPETKTLKRELDMAKQLIEAQTAKFEPKKYKDEYQDELAHLVSSKLKGKKVAKPATAPKPTAVKDLMSALRASLGESTPAKQASSKKKRTRAGKGGKVLPFQKRAA